MEFLTLLAIGVYIWTYYHRYIKVGVWAVFGALIGGVVGSLICALWAYSYFHFMHGGLKINEPDDNITDR